MMSVIFKVPQNANIRPTLPEQTPLGDEDIFLNSINAKLPPDIMPNTRKDTGFKVIDAIVADTVITASLPPAWQILYLARLISIEPRPILDEEGNQVGILPPWQIIVEPHASFKNYLHDIDDEGGRPFFAFEPHRFMGLPQRDLKSGVIM